MSSDNFSLFFYPNRKYGTSTYKMFDLVTSNKQILEVDYHCLISTYFVRVLKGTYGRFYNVALYWTFNSMLVLEKDYIFC